MNNTISDLNICGFSDSTYLSITNLGFVVYYIATPIYFIIGTLTRSLCMLAFYQQYKKEREYSYQIIISFTDLLEIIAETLGNCKAFSGYRGLNALWFQENYYLMWFAAHLASPLQQAFITTSVLVSLGMAVDRLLAMIKPFWYRTANHIRQQLITMFICILLGLLTNTFDVFRYNLIKIGDYYQIAVNTKYVALPVAISLEWTRCTFRLSSLVALIICNIVMLIRYRLSISQISQMNENKRIVIKRKSTQRTLILLVICQSIYTAIDTIMYNIYFGLAYTEPTFTDCVGKIMAPAVDLITLLTGVLEFFTILVISKKFQKILLTYCISVRKKVTNWLAPINVRM